MFFGICYYFNFNFVDRRCYCYCCCCVFAARAARRRRIVENCVFGKQQQQQEQKGQQGEGGAAGHSAVKPKLSCPQTPFGGPLLTKSLWARRRQSVLTVDACAATTTATMMNQPRQRKHNQWGKCKQFMRPSAQVLEFLPHLTGISKERERERKRRRERAQRTCHYVIRIHLTDNWVN